MFKKLYLIKQKITFFVLFCFGFAQSQTTGFIDNAFSSSGFRPFGDFVNAVLCDNNGKIYVGGAFPKYNNISSFGVVKLNNDGTLDSSYPIGTGIYCSGDPGVVSALALQQDGKLICAGSFTTFNCFSTAKIFRLNTDGSLDNTFLAGTGANGTIMTVKIQTDGKILIGGDFTTYNGITKKALARLNSDGSLDTTFNIGTGFIFTSTSSSLLSIWSIQQQSDEKIIVGGNFTSYNDTTIGAIARLNLDGTIDTTFNTGSGANATVSTINILSDNKIFVAGNFTTFNGLPQGKIVRLNSNGTLDNTFVTPYINGAILSSKIQNNGKIIIAGDFTYVDVYPVNRIMILNNNGSLDSNFYYGNSVWTGADNKIKSISIQTDGKILVGGDFHLYNNVARNNLTRLTGDVVLSRNEFKNPKNKIFIYPNPTNNFITIQSKENSIENFEYKILDLTGRIVKSGNSKYNEQINVESLENGNYIIRIETENGEKFTEKLIKN